MRERASSKKKKEEEGQVFSDFFISRTDSPSARSSISLSLLSVLFLASLLPSSFERRLRASLSELGKAGGFEALSLRSERATVFYFLCFFLFSSSPPLRRPERKERKKSQAKQRRNGARGVGRRRGARRRGAAEGSLSGSRGSLSSSAGAAGKERTKANRF